MEESPGDGENIGTSYFAAEASTENSGFFPFFHNDCPRKLCS